MTILFVTSGVTFVTCDVSDTCHTGAPKTDINTKNWFNQVSCLNCEICMFFFKLEPNLNYT
jgi:hypothetical protein